MATKRKASADGDVDVGERHSKRIAKNEGMTPYFRPGLFDDSTLEAYTSSYANSSPYLIAPSNRRELRADAFLYAATSTA